ncbi:hypothetical protein WISP_65816 [Willisornis vidua]|uniref:Uncharacterized protein n=1 Tax=Willisornis vidua TaxID=1566151 RepID=A0ABQ9DDM4_9PASS|nr:hypothetical protein WISP_65816 [Willisornis vidua]
MGAPHMRERHSVMNCDSVKNTLKLRAMSVRVITRSVPCAPESGTAAAFSLYKSLSEGVSLKNQPACAFSTSEAGLQDREDVVTLTYRQIEDLAAQLQQTRSEQKDTEMKLQQALEASQEANEKVQKFHAVANADEVV